jgi:hypothetical protein
MVKKQQMRWTREGAHLLLQTRVKTLDGDLLDKFVEWYPGMGASSATTQLPVASGSTLSCCLSIYQHPKKIGLSSALRSEDERRRFDGQQVGRAERFVQGIGSARALGEGTFTGYSGFDREAIPAGGRSTLSNHSSVNPFTILALGRPISAISLITSKALGWAWAGFDRRANGADLLCPTTFAGGAADVSSATPETRSIVSCPAGASLVVGGAAGVRDWSARRESPPVEDCLERAWKSSCSNSASLCDRTDGFGGWLISFTSANNSSGVRIGSTRNVPASMTGGRLVARLGASPSRAWPG